MRFNLTLHISSVVAPSKSSLQEASSLFLPVLDVEGVKVSRVPLLQGRGFEPQSAYINFRGAFFLSSAAGSSRSSSWPKP